MPEQTNRHTPGPWTYDPDDDEIRTDADGSVLFDGHNATEADSLLAAAAPDLLAATEATIEMIPWRDIECRICGDSLDTHDESCPMPLLSAAIAKARGEAAAVSPTADREGIETVTDDTYNGWVNRETWAMHLWLSSDEGLNYAAQEYAASDKDGYALKDWIDELVHDATEGGPEYRDTRLMLNDIGSLYRVDWRDVREAFVEED